MEDRIQTQIAKDGSSVYIYESNEKKTALNSLYSPEKEINRFLKELEGLEKKFAVIIGTGNGLVIEKLVQSDAYSDNIHFLFIEPFSEINLSQYTSNTILKNIDKLSFYKLDGFSSLVFSKFLAKFATISVSIHIHPNYLRANKGKVEEVIAILKEGIDVQRILNNTEQKFAVDWIVEPLLNLKVMDQSINLKHYKDQFQGETAILVAAGPSLQENMSFIRRMARFSHIFAVGPAIRPLLKNGIKPDYALSIDSSDTNYQTHFMDLLYDGTLIFETMSNHRIQKEHKGQLVDSMALLEQITSLAYRDIFGFPHSVPSVAIFALLVIEYLGFKDVYLVGQDLALVNGNYYADGVKPHKGMSNSKADLFVENNRGEKVGTTKALKLFLDSFEAIIETFPKNSINIMNVSEFGARIKGTEFVDPDKVNDSTLKKVIQITAAPNQPKQPVAEFYHDFFDKLTAIKDEIESADKVLKGYLECRIFSKNEQLEMLQTFKEIAGNEIVERILLSNITFLFDSIINKVIYYDQKKEYTIEDLFALTKELSALYKLMAKYLTEILDDPRIRDMKKEYVENC